MDIAGVKKMILVDFVEYNEMKRHLQAFLDKEDGGVSGKKESEDLSLRKETIDDDITQKILNLKTKIALFTSVVVRM